MRAITESQGKCEIAVVISSTMPSAKYSCSGSPLMFWNGSTASEGLSGNGGVGRRRRLPPSSPHEFRDVANKADTLAGERADQPLSRAIIAYRPTHRIDPRGQRRFRDDPPAPHRLQKIVLGDYAVSMLHEEGQQIEDFGLEIDVLGSPAQLAALDIQPVVAKRENHELPSGSASHSRPKRMARLRYGERKVAVKHFARD